MRGTEGLLDLGKCLFQSSLKLCRQITSTIKQAEMKGKQSPVLSKAYDLSSQSLQNQPKRTSNWTYEMRKQIEKVENVKRNYEDRHEKEARSRMRAKRDGGE